MRIDRKDVITSQKEISKLKRRRTVSCKGGDRQIDGALVALAARQPLGTSLIFYHLITSDSVWLHAETITDTHVLIAVILRHGRTLILNDTDYDRTTYQVEADVLTHICGVTTQN